ncbi:hypothetical protein NLM33_41495 [Bradyrhizobium sp. CCGUVB1N3]|uniref:hypothetical protein n=1 Tax=Bradyrhizobium sp. CCGUVB1N3 TaxID=2949629 RepID=UPI0020B1C4CF|nr:hypothetical protein [Bradyrhizobium sp. CCGUVB1N3]MCP3476650.1 hypothetical protein [Bradyrhizobium sp. CCGUVB1N3]
MDPYSQVPASPDIFSGSRKLAAIAAAAVFESNFEDALTFDISVQVSIPDRKQEILALQHLLPPIVSWAIRELFQSC